MKTFFWYLGKGLQILGLLTVGFALVVGLRTEDSKQEITLLSMGAVEFLMGLLMLKTTSGPSQ